MNPNDFEQRLQRQPLREVPAAWRAQILREARLAAEQDAATPWWRELLWPHPVAWGSLAAAWVIITVLRFATPSLPAAVAKETVVPAVDAIRMAIEQRRELVTLLASPQEPARALPPKPPGPRSARQTEFVAA